MSETTLVCDTGPFIDSRLPVDDLNLINRKLYEMSPARGIATLTMLEGTEGKQFVVSSKIRGLDELRFSYDAEKKTLVH